MYIYIGKQVVPTWATRSIKHFWVPFRLSSLAFWPKKNETPFLCVCVSWEWIAFCGETRNRNGTRCQQSSVYDIPPKHISAGFVTRRSIYIYSAEPLVVGGLNLLIGQGDDTNCLCSTSRGGTFVVGVTGSARLSCRDVISYDFSPKEA